MNLNHRFAAKKDEHCISVKDNGQYYQDAILMHCLFLDIRENQKSQTRLKGGSWVRVWKVRVSWVLNVQQTEEHSTELRVWSPKILFKYTHTSFYFWKVITLESVLISYSCTLQDIIIFHGGPTTHPLPNLGIATLATHRIDACALDNGLFHIPKG